MSINTDYWDKRRHTIDSQVGGWVMGEGAYTHGVNLLAQDFLGNHSYMQVHVLNVTGRLPTREVADWIEATFIGQSWPDSRIWCNAIGALGGESKCSPTAAVAAGIQAASSEVYSGRTMLASCRFIQDALSQYNSGSSVQDIVNKEIKRLRGKVDIAGFARPIAKGDERVPLMWAYARKLGFEEGPHEKLALEIEAYLSQHHDEHINIGGCIAAFLSDQGFSGKELYRISAYIVSSGVEASYTDYIDRPQGSFRPMRCDDIEYTGKPIRSVPEKA